jgi:hypothetical protein
MRFAIRDDDTNFFTTPEELEHCYAGIWDICPPSLSLISHVKGNWKFWVEEIYASKHLTDWDKWKLDDRVYPISENRTLVNFLKEKIKENQLDLTFHAIHHRNEDDHLPMVRYNNYIHGAEFFTMRDLGSEIAKTLVYLNSLFNVKISVFTPPQNLLSMKGYHAVIANKLNIVGGGIPLWKKEKNIQGLINIGKQIKYKIKRIDYPYVLRFRDHCELIYHYPLQPTTTLQDLISKFDKVYKENGDFVLSTHYIEFNRAMTYDNKKTMKDVFFDFFNYLNKNKNVEFLSVSQLLKQKHR